MKKKTKIIIICASAALVIFGLIKIVILPRMAMSAAAKYIMPGFEKKGGYYDGYDVNNDCFVGFENEYIKLSLPEGYTILSEPTEENGNLPYVGKWEDTNEDFLIITEPDDTVLDLTDYEHYVDNDNVSSERAFESLIESFESLGNGLPDSRFASYKAIVLLDEEDYSFWDLNRAVAFNVLGTMRLSAMSLRDSAYIYESEDKNGILYLTENPEGKEDSVRYDAIFEAFPLSDPNYSYTIMISMNSLEDVYAVINSLEFKGK